MARLNSHLQGTPCGPGPGRGDSFERPSGAETGKQLSGESGAGGRQRGPFASLEREILRSKDPIPAALAYHTATLKAGCFERAAAVLADALKRNPHSRRLHFLLIDLLLRQEKRLEAMDAIEAAMAGFGVDDGMLAAALSVRAKLGPHATRRRPGVSLCMIVRDEAEHLARCLHSAKPVVDEIIIVDTGSIDCSKEIARAFGAKVIEQAWENDFSKARNRALAEATQDRILVLDGDEVISPKDYDNFKNLLQADPGAPVAYTLQTRNYSDRLNTVGFRLNGGDYAEEAGAGWFPSDKVRLFPNDPRLRFHYPVHEVVEPALKGLKIPTRRCDIPVHHYGKLAEKRTAAKTRVYHAMGRRKLSAAQTDPAALREAAIQASHLGHHEEALELWQRFVQAQHDSAEAFVNLASAFFNLRRYSEAAASAEKAMALDPSLKEAHFNAALAYLILGRAERAVAILAPVVKRMPDYPPAAFILAACHACTGSETLFRESLRRLSSTALGTCLPISIADVAERLLAAGQRDYAAILLQSAVRHNCTSPEIDALIKHCRTAA